jgi:hypothetical protein
MPAITSTRAMIHKMASRLPLFAASNPRASNRSPPFILPQRYRVLAYSCRSIPSAAAVAAIISARLGIQRGTEVLSVDHLAAEGSRQTSTEGPHGTTASPEHADALQCQRRRRRHDMIESNPGHSQQQVLLARTVAQAPEIIDRHLVDQQGRSIVPDVGQGRPQYCRSPTRGRCHPRRHG